MGLGQDLRFALRGFRRNRAFTALVVATLAIGIGANTAIFSVVNAVLLRPLPYKKPDQVVHVFRTQPPVERAMFSIPAFRDLAGQQQVFQGFAAHAGITFNLTGAGETERLAGRTVTGDFFALFGVSPALGRFLEPADDRPGSPRVAVISHGLWQRRFGGASDVIGRSVSLNGASATIVGVAPRQFRFPETVEVWTPARLDAEQRGRGDNFLRIVARLRDDVPLAQAAAQMDQLAGVLAREHPENHLQLSILLARVQQDEVRNVRGTLWLLLGAVGVVLLIACANVASLLLARAADREREFAVRTAIGAGSWRIIRQLLIESAMLSLAGGALGVLLALWGLDSLLALAPRNLPHVDDIGVDARVLGFSLVLSLLTGVLFGLAPAWQMARADHHQALKQGGRAVAGGARQASLRRTLVVTEIALSLVLLVGAGLLIGSVRRLLAVNPGFPTAHLLAAQVAYPRRVTAGDPPDLAQRIRRERTAFVRALEEAAAAVPGVEAVGLINDLPVTGDNAMSGNFKIEGQPDIEWATAPTAERRFVTPRYFAALGIPLLKGRPFSDGDTPEARDRLPILINEALARRFFAGRDPIGQRLLVMDGPNEIIGVVGDARQWGLARATTPDVYFSLRQRTGNPEVSVLVRTATAPAAVAEALRRALQSVAPDAPIFKVRTMNQVVAASVAQERFNTIVMTAFAGLAVLLALVGLYGLMSHAVAQRAHELGVRVALGAQAGDVVKLVVGQGMRLALVGVGLGLVAAWALAGLLDRLLFGVEARDPQTFAVVALLLVAVALLASYLPARRAARIDPMTALRAE